MPLAPETQLCIGYGSFDRDGVALDSPGDCDSYVHWEAHKTMTDRGDGWVGTPDYAYGFGLGKHYTHVSDGDWMGVSMTAAETAEALARAAEAAAAVTPPHSPEKQKAEKLRASADDLAKQVAAAK